LTTAPHWFAEFDTVMLAGQVIAHASIIVNLKSRVALLPAPSLTWSARQ